MHLKSKKMRELYENYISDALYYLANHKGFEPRFIELKKRIEPHEEIDANDVLEKVATKLGIKINWDR